MCWTGGGHGRTGGLRICPNFELWGCRGTSRMSWILGQGNEGDQEEEAVRRRVIKATPEEV